MAGLFGRRATVMIVGTIIAVAGAPAGAVVRTYTLIDLGNVESQAQDLNAHGQSAGWFTDGPSRQAHAFLHNGGMIDLGLLQGGTSARATALNDLGEVVGLGGRNDYGPEFQEVTQAFLWQNGTMIPLGALYDPSDFNRRHGYSEAHAINDQGQVAGFSEIFRCGSRHAFLWQDGAMLDISGGPGNPSYSHAFGINDLGQVVGYIVSDACTTTPPPARAFLWADGTMSLLALPTGHTTSSAHAINGVGQVVGTSGDGSVTHAILWDGQSMTDLGVLAGDSSSVARDINDAGLIVGASWGQTGSRAFIWQDGEMHDLDDLLDGVSGWDLQDATGIDDDGGIAGFGLYYGQMRAFVLLPVEPSFRMRRSANRERMHR